jgi:hypothetical protein
MVIVAFNKAVFFFNPIFRQKIMFLELSNLKQRSPKLANTSKSSSFSNTCFIYQSTYDTVTGEFHRTYNQIRLRRRKHSIHNK